MKKSFSLEETLEVCIESIVEDLVKVTTSGIKSAGEEIISTLIGLLEALTHKQEQTHSMLHFL